MAKYRSALPQLEGGIFLSYCGMETISQTEADFVSAFTLCYPEEAIGG